MPTSLALLVIDMQLCGFDGKITGPIDNGAELLARVAGLIAVCRSNSVPVIYVQTCAAPGQPYARDSHGWEIHPDIAPGADDPVVFKRHSSAFDDTELHELLLERRVAGVITCGIWSEFCVTNTSLSALELDFEVIVAADAHGTRADNGIEAVEIISRQNQLLRGTAAHVAGIERIREIVSAA